MPFIKKTDNKLIKYLTKDVDLLPDLNGSINQIRHIEHLLNDFTLFKNRIINGDFSIWQRGKSFTFTSDPVALTDQVGYAADRVLCVNARAGGKFTVSKSSIDGINSYKITVDTPPTDLSWDGTYTRFWCPFDYKFEGYHIYDAAINQTSITVAFLFKSNVSGLFSFSIRNMSYVGQTGVNDQSQVDSFVTTFLYPGDEIARRIEITIPMNHNWIYGVFNDELLGFEMFIGLIGDSYTTTILNQWQHGFSGNASGAPYAPLTSVNYTNWAAQAGNYIEIAQLQLEPGDKATEFEYVPEIIQLLRCQRYFFSTLYPHYDVSNLQNAVTSIAYTSIDPYDRLYFFRVRMRTVPSITTYAFETGTVGKYRDRTAGADVTACIGGVTNEQYVVFCGAGDLTPGNLITWHFTADAEL